MLTGIQYYRPPFPETRRWADDLSRIRDTGLSAIQLWCVWGWIEGEPGVYQYDDYDRIIELAGERGLGVVLSTVAEVQPFWIHRVVPGAEMVDALNRPVVSCPRQECNVGLTPGGCFDHPEIASRMQAFFSDIAGRYGQLPHLQGWDCWNETRWNVHAEALTCYCDHTLAAFRRWLEEQYGDLAGLNAAWQRRYPSWEDVRPSKRVAGPFSDLLDFARYQSWRTTRHARFRYEAIRAQDPTHVITAHGPMPTIHTPPVAAEVPMCRGNDWELADVLDGVGSSHFPISQKLDGALLGTRLQEVRSAAGKRIAWISEMQASSSWVGYHTTERRRGSPLSQQRWLLEGLSRGYNAVIFWAWRDEVFCRESGGGGLCGNDGLAEERMAGIRAFADFAARERETLEAYRPDPARVGVLFCPDNVVLTWARQGDVDDARWSMVGYALALEQLGIPYEFVEASHLDVLQELDVLFAPWCQMLPAATREAIEAFVARGGTLLTEAEADAFTPNGFFRYPDERPLMQRIGVRELGRRPLPEGDVMPVQLGGITADIPLAHFCAPLHAPGAEVLSVDAEGQPLLVCQAVDAGRAYVLGGFAGRRYFNDRQPGLEALVGYVCRHGRPAAGISLGIEAPGKSLVYSRTGWSGDQRVLWVFNTSDDEPRVLTVDLGEQAPGTVRELLSDATLPTEEREGRATCALTLAPGASAVLCWLPAPVPADSMAVAEAASASR